MFPVLGMLFFLAPVLSAQEKTEVTIQVKKDGKLVQDTTYAFDDATQAQHAIKMMELLSGDHGSMGKYHYTTAHGEDGNRTVVFISEDGGETRIKKVQGDSLVWVTEGMHGGDNVQVIRKKVVVGEQPGEEHVIIMRSGDDETFDLLLDKDTEPGEGNKKVVKVIVSGDEEGSWHVETKELKHVEEDVYVISGENAEVELKEIMEEHGHGEQVKVIVVETKTDKKSQEQGDEVLIEKEKEKSKKKPEKQ